jgi:hypothetical protein
MKRSSGFIQSGSKGTILKVKNEAHLKITLFRGFYLTGIKNSFVYPNASGRASGTALINSNHYSLIPITMCKPSLLGWLKNITLAMLLLSGMHAAAQSTADQSFKSIPQSTKDNAENKATAKANTVSNNAMNKIDSASNKAFKGFTGLFKKKKKPGADSTKVPVAAPINAPAADSTKLHSFNSIPTHKIKPRIYLATIINRKSNYQS